MIKVPDWFSRRIADGVQFILALPLQGAPRARPTEAVATDWTELLWQGDTEWDESLDNARLYRAFSDLAARAERFPAPHSLLHHLGPRPPQTGRSAMAGTSASAAGSRGDADRRRVAPSSP